MMAPALVCLPCWDVGNLEAFFHIGRFGYMNCHEFLLGLIYFVAKIIDLEGCWSGPISRRDRNNRYGNIGQTLKGAKVEVLDE